MKLLRYSPRRMTLLYAARDDRLGYQTTDGEPTHLIIDGRHAGTAAANKTLQELLDRELIWAINGELKTLPGARGHLAAWEDRRGDCDDRLLF